MPGIIWPGPSSDLSTRTDQSHWRDYDLGGERAPLRTIEVVAVNGARLLGDEHVLRRLVADNPDPREGGRFEVQGGFLLPPCRCQPTRFHNAERSATSTAMPQKRGRIIATHTARITKTVGAPLKFVYDWCTDFREDDGTLSKSRPQYRVLTFGKDRVVRVRLPNPRAKNRAIALELIRLRPPDAWHVDQIDEIDLASVDYRVTSLGRHRTRVRLEITERWMSAEHPGRAEWVRNTSAYWDRLVAAMEKHYDTGRPARG